MAKLTLTLPSDREIQIVRVFDAPRALVFEAWTTPKYVRQFLLGPPGWAMPICEIDLRVGGRYRYVWRHDDGREMGMGGTFREIAPPERIVSTEAFDESWYPGEALVSNVLTEQGGKTVCTITILYESKEARDIAAKSDMDKGMEAGFERLDQVLAERAKG
jgi:uncharacterized protein YndB with AHSA1/START domain